jgi:hypothetical protein
MSDLEGKRVAVLVESEYIPRRSPPTGGCSLSGVRAAEPGSSGRLDIGPVT